ncbi:MAG: hypothetical protein JSR36_07905 [Proteobacteria bacterium]|nr:hypothetical protein [Pseudomonadota bacterium]
MTIRTVFPEPTPRRLAARACLCLVFAGGLLGGCVPVPFRPSAAVTQTAVMPQDDAPRLEAASARSEAQSVARTIQRNDTRITLVSLATLASAGGSPRVTLDEAASAAGAGQVSAAADYLLTVGVPVHRELHDTGAAAPFLFMPSIVGYEKIQSEEILPALLVDLKHPEAPQVLCASSTYSEVMTGLVYGVMTIAMPERGLRESLAREVTHAMTVAHPEGEIRLLVLSQVAKPLDPKMPPAKAALAAIPAGCRQPPASAMTAAVH